MTTDPTIRTHIRFERNAMMSAAHLTADDGGTCYVFCSIPGGRPWMALDIRGDRRVSIVNGPQCETHAEFKSFVTERFGA